MKIYLTASLFILYALGCHAQDIPQKDLAYGKITFEEKMKLDIQLEGDAAQYASMMPKEKKSIKILSFSPKATLFEESKDIKEEMGMAMAHEGMQIRMMTSGSNLIFTDLEENIILEQRDFMNRIFLIEKKITQTNWKISGNQKMILGYPCMEAVTIDTTGVITRVWFAPSITTRSGPAGVASLPGMVLEMDKDNGKVVYLATSIESLTQSELKVQKPKEGKKVTNDEFKLIVAEKMKEMGIEEGQSGSGSIRVVIRH